MWVRKMRKYDRGGGDGQRIYEKGGDIVKGRGGIMENLHLEHQVEEVNIVKHNFNPGQIDKHTDR